VERKKIGFVTQNKAILARKIKNAVGEITRYNFLP
jgi:hypothetical protein